ncbi:4-phosphoerythronate dehydrogenase PdxB [Halomonas sp. BM-2019]|uniref:4-phosphoerythronate dehydrogenase PdxB n=1 Tax=Halomonas sp. BM-2019 TaxID=2811227 RepID=UPI001B3C3430|nr:MAG: 4-phosphoerythronate dehydrogenase PdxB [Halomonas sp. BM-2019]
MRILVDTEVPAAEACFAALGDVIRRPGREITASDLRDVDALVVRSLTRVDEALLAEANRLRFVGTCTIGTDHIATGILAERGVAFASAPGCNAEAVVDQVLGSLSTLAERQGWRLLERRVGVVGAGNVGGRLLRRLAAMGVDCLACDPPRAEKERTDFVDLETLIDGCDVLCLHTPLVREGPHPTYHLLGAQAIAELVPGTVLLNAGRGDCLDGGALRQRLAGQGDISAVLDVWEHEPGIDPALRDLAEIATPHIAGHSLDGKRRGTQMIYRALCRELGLPARVSLADLLPPPPLRRLELGPGLAPEEALRLCIRAVHDVRRDHDSLLRESRRQGMARGFDACRANYPLRREFATLEVALAEPDTGLAALLAGAGFSVVSS